MSTSPELPPLPSIVTRADGHYRGEGLADAVLAYGAACAAAADQWRETVDDMLSVCHMVASDDPRESVNRLINWHCSVALDPCVSSDAQALINRGAAAEREAIAAQLECARHLEGFGCACEPKLKCGTCKARDVLDKVLVPEITAIRARGN